MRSKTNFLLGLTVNANLPVAVFAGVRGDCIQGVVPVGEIDVGRVFR